MEYSKKHLELRISYLRHLMDSVPHGYFGYIRDKKAVYISYDPKFPEFTAKNKGRFFLSGAEGQIYAPLIEQYLKLKAEYDNLTALWNSEYWAEPRNLTYPLLKTRKNFMDSTYFNNAIPNVNSYKNNRPIDFEGMDLRSKNELIACELLTGMGLEVKIEPEIKFDDFTIFDPDILFNIPEADKCVALEIDGAMDKDSYKTKAENRKMNYHKYGFAEYRDVLFLRLYDPYEFDIYTLESMIKVSIERNISDIIFPSSTQQMNKAEGQILLQNRVSCR